MDPFEKHVFETHDGEVVEAVRIPLEKEGRFTVCVSSQASGKPLKPFSNIFGAVPEASNSQL